MPLELWFLNVGHGDCTTVKFPSGRMAMIDINVAPGLEDESAREIALSVGRLDEINYRLSRALGERIEAVRRYEQLLVDPVDFWLTHFPNQEIFRFIATHPDMDHLSGLARLADRVPMLNFWDVDNSKQMTKKDFEDSPYDYRDWQRYQVLRESETDPKALRLYRGAEEHYWTEDGVTILSPTAALCKQADQAEDWHHASYLLRLQHGESVVLLTGDPSLEALEDVYRNFDDDVLKAGLLTAPHHGRDTGFYEPFVKAVSPTYTIVSVGKKPENDATNKYRRYSEHVYSTRFHGTMHAQCWHDGEIRLDDHQGNRLE